MLILLSSATFFSVGSGCWFCFCDENCVLLNSISTRGNIKKAQHNAGLEAINNECVILY